MTIRRIVIIGATSAIAEHCARLWSAASPVDLVLVGRSAEKTEQVAADLRVRNDANQVESLVADFQNPEEIQKTVGEIASAGKIDIVLIAHGSLPDQELAQNDLALVKETLEVNAVSPAMFAEAFAQYMQHQNHGTIAIIGSVAGDRGRKSNYVYGSAKGLVDRYAQGLQHRFADSNLRIVLIKPGPTDTPMTAGSKRNGAKLAPVEAVAADIVRGVEMGKTVIYTPKIWKPIMFVVRHLPGSVFRRTNF